MAESLPKHVAKQAVTGDVPAHKYKRGRFIPIGRGELAGLLGRNVEPDEKAAEHFRVICQLLDEVVHREYRTRAKRLKDNYAVVDPDIDVVTLERHLPEELTRRTDEIFADVRYLLEKANFHELPRADVDAAVSALSPWGMNLQVDLDIFDRLIVFARGDKIDHRTKRDWKRLLKLKHYRIPLYQRLMIVFRPQGEALAAAGYLRDRVYLKLFKNIPEGDVDMVLPGTRVRMTMLDQGKIIFPILSGIAMTVWKIIKGALVVAAVGIYGLIAYLTLIVATVGYGWRSFFGYMRTKEKYQLNLTQSLYYQKLDGDLGAILRLIDEAEEQEYREALTAWFLLWRAAPLDGFMIEELDQNAEQLLQAELKRDVDFDVQDAVDKMIHWRMIDVQHDGRLTARSPERVIEALEAILAGTADADAETGQQILIPQPEDGTPAERLLDQFGKTYL